MKIKNFIIKNKLYLLFLLVIFSFCLFFSTFAFSDSDYYWHIKAGEWIINNKSFLLYDKFSWVLYGTRWISHEWLFESLLYLLSLIFVKSHIFIYVFISLFSLQVLLFINNKKGYFKNLSFSLIWIIFMLIFGGFLTARPHMFSFILLCITIFILRDLFFNEDSKKIYFLPFVSIIWSNVHGGSSSLVYLFTLLFLVCGLFKFKFLKIQASRLSKKQIKKYLLVLLISVLCLGINPHGIQMLFYPYENMADSFMMTFIAEWQPTNLSNISHYPYLLLIIFIFFVLMFSKKRIKFLDLTLFLVGVFLGLKSIRFWPYVYIISTYFIFDYVTNRKLDKGSFSSMILLSCLFIGLSIFSSGRFFDSDKIIDDEIIELVKSSSPKRLYNYYDYGGYLIYNDIDVFVDGRFDLYSKYTIRDYYDICSLNDNSYELIDKYDFDYFLIPDSSRLSSYLNSSDSYQLLLNKEGISFYKQIK